MKTEKYEGWLISNNIYKRTLAIFGHMIFGYSILVIFLLILAIIEYIILGGY